jgi:hypothetical protein
MPVTFSMGRSYSFRDGGTITRKDDFRRRMYSTCIFCNSSLGANEVFEHFPVGRRIAYDQATGRLWVVCRMCERWNLTPLETRWEAVEEAERVFRATPLKVSGENIALAQTAEGLDIVRIGKPPAGELMAWRYGDQFGRRRRRHIAVAGSLIVAGGAAAAVKLVALAGVEVGSAIAGAASVLNLAHVFGQLARQRGGKRVFIPGAAGGLLHLLAQDARMTALVPLPGGAWRLEVPHRTWIGKVGKGAVTPAVSTLTGDVALRAMSRLLPSLNTDGGSARTVSEAAATIQGAGSIEKLVAIAATNTEGRKTHLKVPKDKSVLAVLPPRIRLALEMTLHEDDERRAMEGELAELAARWKEADALARIADDLLIPPAVEGELEKLRQN